MFLKKLFNFNKDFRYYAAKGDDYLREERFADARDAFTEAMQKMAESGAVDPPFQSMIREKLAEAGNRLGLLNLAEAEHALTIGNMKKTEEHLRIVMDLAEDAAIRDKANFYWEKITADVPERTSEVAKHSCFDCATDSGEPHQESHAADQLPAYEDRFELYIQTLPGDLPERYKNIGGDFAHGCLLNRDGHGEAALEVFVGLAALEESDIINYEMALIYYQSGDLDRCERLLRQAIDLNGQNPLCYLGLVQLLGETGRVAEALPFLHHMINNELIPDQAGLLLGDAYLLLADEQSALESYSKVLSSPGYAKEAAAKLIPLLEKQGRPEEAAYLAKKYSKGCC